MIFPPVEIVYPPPVEFDFSIWINKLRKAKFRSGDIDEAVQLLDESDYRTTTRVHESFWPLWNVLVAVGILVEEEYWYARGGSYGDPPEQEWSTWVYIKLDNLNNNNGPL